jgi:hypothetical protein
MSQLYELLRREIRRELREIIAEEFKNQIRQLLEASMLDKKDEIDDWGGIELAMEVTKLKKQTIYGLTCGEKIPHYKKGKKLYFSRSELLIWIKSDAFRKISNTQ